MSDNHGNTPAAWTAVAVATLGFLVMSIGAMAVNWPTFWVGVALVPIGGIVGIVMSRAGYGASH